MRGVEEDDLDRAHSGRYIGGQSLRASTKTGFVVSGGVTEERIREGSLEYAGRGQTHRWHEDGLIIQGLLFLGQRL